MNWLKNRVATISRRYPFKKIFAWEPQILTKCHTWEQFAFNIPYCWICHKWQFYNSDLRMRRPAILPVPLLRPVSSICHTWHFTSSDLRMRRPAVLPVPLLCPENTICHTWQFYQLWSAHVHCASLLSSQSLCSVLDLIVLICVCAGLLFSPSLYSALEIIFVFYLHMRRPAVLPVPLLCAGCVHLLPVRVLLLPELTQRITR